MSRLSDIAIRTPPVSADATGQVVYTRFAEGPETLAIAVVDDQQRPVGLVERHEFSLRIASPYGRALYSGRSITLLMDPAPLTVEGTTSTSEFTGENLSTRAFDLLKGFVIVEDGRYLGVGNSMALLQAANQANRDLAKSFKFLFDANPIAMCVWDRESLKLAAFNKAALQQYGFTREQASTLTVLDILPEREHGRYFDLVEQGRAPDGEGADWTHRRADGSELIIQPFLRAFVHGGRPSILAALFDITQRKRTEEEIHRTRAFLDAVIESIPQMLVVKDTADHRFILVNRAGEELIGIPRGEMLGKTDHDLFPEWQADHFVAKDLQAVAAGGLQSTAEEPISMPDGRELTLETKKIAVPGPSGGHPFLLSISNDITERKRDAEALRVARDAADASNRAKSEFLANMSHEIRTPLNGVIGVADALARSDLDPAHREMVAIIQSSADALNRVLSDVLDLARVEAGRLNIAREPFQLCTQVRQAAALFESNAREKGLEFTVDIQPALNQDVVGDAIRIKQILFNLLSNAIKFTAEGSVELAVFEDREQLIFEVRDTGVGFDPVRAEALFGRFEQADGSITRRFGGSGLGLAISRDLAELMGGRLSASSNPGRGSVFRLAIPLERGVAPHVVPARPEPTQLNARSSAEEPAHVLLADDHPINRKVVQLILASASVQLVSVTNGAEAVEAFQRQRFDVVLMDLQMPVMDGLSAIRALRAHEHALGVSATPIYALTANALPEHVEAARVAGADGLLAKPITAAALLASLDEALGARPAGQPTVAAAVAAAAVEAAVPKRNRRTG